MAELQLAQAGQQMPYIDTVPFCGGPGQTPAAWPGINSVCLIRFRLAKPLQVNTMAYFVGTAAGNVDLAVGTIDPVTGAFVKLASTGSTVAAGASALQSIALAGGAIWLPANVDLAFGMGASSLSLTLSRTTNITAITALGQAYNKTPAFPIASTTMTAGSLGNYQPYVWMGFV